MLKHTIWRQLGTDSWASRLKMFFFSNMTTKIYNIHSLLANVTPCLVFGMTKQVLSIFYLYVNVTSDTSAKDKKND